MQSHHWLFMAVLIIGGYVLGRYWTQPAQWVGLP